MDYKVIFSGNGFDCTAYFNASVDCLVFAELMAKDGRLVKVVSEGKDLTEKFVTAVSISEVVKR